MKYSNSLLSAILSTFFLIWLYSFTFHYSLSKKEKKHNNRNGIKIFSLKSLMLGFTLFLMTAPFSILSDILKASDNIINKLFGLFLTILSLAISMILNFTVIIYVLFPNDSIWSSMKKSVDLIVKNIVSCIAFDLSFILWFIIPLILMIAGYFLIFNCAKQLTLGMEVFYTISFPIMFGLGFYFYPFYNISKFSFCKALLSR